jgi:hypothetical protein
LHKGDDICMVSMIYKTQIQKGKYLLHGLYYMSSFFINIYGGVIFLKVNVI